jgi:hypothetical protein
VAAPAGRCSRTGCGGGTGRRPPASSWWTATTLTIVGSLPGLYGCQASCDLFSISKDDLIEQVQGIITVGEFYAMAAGGQIIFT